MFLQVLNRIALKVIEIGVLNIYFENKSLILKEMLYSLVCFCSMFSYTLRIIPEVCPCLSL